MSEVLFLVLPLVVFLPVFYLSVFAHELGHALVGRWKGLRITSFGLGTAHPFWVGDWRGTRVFLCRTRPFQGMTFSTS
ncbi:MAG: site-2 protease family protein [Planctomycetes bacterium]|nr:site-2 protease family protein [Planctomycetota bacterium]